ncbi:MAG: 4Fe-4S binding protein, partial [bacterium]
VLIFLTVTLVFWLRFLERESRVKEVGDLKNRYVVAVVGFVSFSLVILVIYSFQAVVGLLFSSIAMISASYMLGAALGTSAVLKPGQRHSNSLIPFLVIALMGLIALGWFLIRSHPGGVNYPYQLLQAGYFLFAALTGAASGPIFVLAVQGSPGSEEKTTSYIHMLDALGASLGALVTGALILPLAGFEYTLLMLLLLLVSALLTLIVKPLREKLKRRPSFGWPGISHFLLAIFFFSFLLNWLVNKNRFPLKTEFDTPTVHEVLGRSGKKGIGSFDFYTDREKEKLLLASCAVEEGKVKGYAGPVNIRLLTGRSRILKAVYLQSRETWSYIADIDNWLKKLEGQNFTTPAGLRRIDSIDAMTGASVTSDAVVKGIKGALKRCSEDLLGQTWPREKPEPAWFLLKQTKIIFLILFLLAAAGVYHLDIPALRKLYLLISAGFLGFYLNAPLTLVNVGQVFSLDFPGWVSTIFWAELAFLAVYLILYGQLWCGYICPFGALQEFISYLKPKTREPLLKAPGASLEKKARFIKYILLSLLAGLYLMTKNSDYFRFDPMLSIFSDSPFQGAQGWHYFLIFSLVGAVFYFRFYCRYFCPVGALLALSNLISRIKKPFRNFSRCDLGITRGNEDLDCIKCQRCRDEKEIKRVSQNLPQNNQKQEASHNNIFRVFLLVGLMLLFLAVRSGKDGAREGGGTSRKVDLHLIIKQIKTGKLSNHEAIFYKKGKPEVIKKQDDTSIFSTYE